MGTTVEEVIAAHRAAGRSFQAAGLTSFVRAEGEGEPIVLLHGLPSSSFLYRKVIGELAARGFAAMSFDLPGLGLADRPLDFDFTFAGLGRFAEAAVDALGLDRFHLVVHDVGGPVGFELAASAPERVRSLTILNTVVAMDAVPFPMEIYAGVGGPTGMGSAAAAAGVPGAYLRDRHQRPVGGPPGRDRRLSRTGRTDRRWGGVPGDHAQPSPRRPRSSSGIDRPRGPGRERELASDLEGHRIIGDLGDDVAVGGVGIGLQREPEGRQPLIQVAAHGRRRDRGGGRCLVGGLVGPAMRIIDKRSEGAP